MAPGRSLGTCSRDERTSQQEKGINHEYYRRSSCHAARVETSSEVNITDQRTSYRGRHAKRDPRATAPDASVLERRQLPDGRADLLTGQPVAQRAVTS